MITLFISESDFPFLTLKDTRGDDFYARLAEECPKDTLQLSEADYADYQRVMAEFEAWQDKILGPPR